MNNIDPERLRACRWPWPVRWPELAGRRRRSPTAPGCPVPSLSCCTTARCRTARSTPVPTTGLLAALLDRIRRRVSEPNLSRGTRPTPQGMPVTARPLTPEPQRGTRQTRP